MDPLVDKMLITAALIGFVELRELSVPAWMVVLIIMREFLITGLRSLAAAREAERLEGEDGAEEGEGHDHGDPRRQVAALPGRAPGR